mgnify:CR=1 FL=1|tara:strand:+ start:430 stop:927 length:498 start_codon:yes stop_codon:yes gene_type:complete
MEIKFSEKLEYIFVTLIFSCFSLFGWISLILNPSVLKNLFKGVDPGAGLLPLIILTFLSISSLYFILKTINIFIEKRDAEKLIVFNNSSFIVFYLFLSIVLYAYLSIHITFLFSTFLFVIFWLFILSSKKEILSIAFILELFATFLFITLIVYVGFMKIMNTPFP